ncbi:uncharacterized protein BDV14DRAFT_199428 [Aspergillus stella-maris]|uniref:uncharacterized protein n=1 Tax=Aspergillus stella-maris TaxID=1810926 RepID=UPI003CCD65B6
MDLLPDCAVACMAQTVPYSSCTLTDVNCICTNQALQAQITACGLQMCTVKDNLLSERALYSICDYPVTVDNNTFKVVTIVGLVLCCIAVALRLAARLLRANIGLDDATALVALASVIAISVIGLINSERGLGKDIWLIAFDDITKFLQSFFAVEALYVVTVALTKISMLLLYLRLFPGERFRLASKVVLAFTIAWGLGCLFATIFLCRPVSYFWHMWDGEHEGSCGDHEALLWGGAVINIVLDVVIIVLPLPTVFKLQMKAEKKVWVFVVFLVGLVVTLVSVLRFVYSLLNFDMTVNPTKSIVKPSIYSIIEIDLSLICTCMPGIRAFASHIHTLIFGEPKTLKSTYASGSNSGYASSQGRTGSKRTLVPSPSGDRSGTFDLEGGPIVKRDEWVVLRETRSTGSSRGDYGGSTTGDGDGYGYMQGRWLDHENL